MIPDAVLIGTGPLTLIHGLALAETGKRVLFVDRAPAIGGAWRTPELLGHAKVEAGVHLIENRSHLNAVMLRLLGSERLMVDPSDFGMILGRRVSMRPARVLLYSLAAGKALLKGSPERSWHSLRNALAALAALRVPFVYPAAGFAAVLAVLGDRLAGIGAEFRFGTEVRRIAVGPDGVVLHTDAGEIQARHLVMSSRAHAPVEGLEALWDHVEAKKVTSLVMKVSRGRRESDGPVSFDTYVEIFGDRVLKRARNISSIVRPPPQPGTALLTVQLRDAYADLSDAELGKLVIERLRSLGLAGPDTAFRDLVRSEVRVATLARRNLARIARASCGRVTVIQTVDLSDYRRPGGANLRRPAEADGVVLTARGERGPDEGLTKTEGRMVEAWLGEAEVTPGWPPGPSRSA